MAYQQGLLMRHRGRHLPLLLIALLSILFISACDSDSDEITEEVIATATGGSADASTETPADTPSAALQAPTPTRTVAPTVNSTAEIPGQSNEDAICVPASSPFYELWESKQQALGCAEGQVIVGMVVEENFEGGKMLWREPIDRAQALVLFNTGQWQIFEHEPFVEGSPEYPCADENTPAQSPPTPRRGFGTMWCDIPAIREGLGNATDAERPYDGHMQTFAEGFLLQNDRNTIYVLYGDGRWEVQGANG